MDFTSLIGIISGFGLIIYAILLGSSDVSIFINVPGMMIVIGGTLAATLVTFQIRDTLAAFKAGFIIFAQDKQNPQVMIATMLQLTKLARREGLIALSRVEADSPFLKRALNMAVHQRHSVNDNKFLANRLTYTTYCFDSKAHAVFCRAAPFISSCIDSFSQELVNQITF